ncbi:MAG: hypothetical protein Q8P41_18220 [Pseudomonadota bacterium]|nr:hypothetical protein [Pseudomonadota bacterium]
MSGPSREALAWLELLEEGRLVRNQGNTDTWDLAHEAGWAEVTRRRGELVLREDHRAAVEARLDRLWPDWREGAAALRTAGERYTPAGWRRLSDARRRTHLPVALPESLNRRTVAAALRDHSKAGLGEVDLAALGAIAVTHDNLLRLRPHPTLVLERGGASMAASEIVTLCGEVCVTDRAFRAGTRLRGEAPRAILLVENLGVYVDVPLPSGWCAVHVPGWNTRMLAHVRDVWPDTPALLFGDLDPNGVAIARALQSFWPGLRWFIPAFADEYLGRALPGVWPEHIGEVPPMVRVLMERGTWLEQEVFVLDGRLVGELERCVR